MSEKPCGHIWQADTFQHARARVRTHTHTHTHTHNEHTKSDLLLKSMHVCAHVRTHTHTQKKLLFLVSKTSPPPSLCTQKRGHKYLSYSGEEFKNMRKTVMVGGCGEDGQTGGVDAPPQSHHGQGVSQHGQDSHIPQQCGTWHGVTGLHQGHRAQEVQHKVPHPLDERLQDVQRCCTTDISWLCMFLFNAHTTICPSISSTQRRSPPTAGMAAVWAEALCHRTKFPFHFQFNTTGIHSVKCVGG